MELDKLRFFKNKSIQDVLSTENEILVKTEEGWYRVRPITEPEQADAVFAEKNWRTEMQKIVPNLNSLFLEKDEQGNLYSVKKELEDHKETESFENQYNKGRKVGEFLRQYHEKTKKGDERTWEKIYQYKIDLLYHEYSMRDFRGDKDYMIFDFIHGNRYLLENREISSILCIPSFSSIKIQKDLIDFPMFQKSYIGDPVFEFWNMNLDYYKRKGYYYGILNGYYHGKIPRVFYKLLALYTVVEVLDASYRKNKVSDTLFQLEMEELAKLYADFSTYKPKWVADCEEKRGGVS